MAKKKLLFVEDDLAFAYIMKGSLKLTGKYEVQTATNGEEGLSKYKEWTPDVIVSDVDMPQMSGIEMVKEIRTVDKRIPILFASAKIQPEELIQGLQTGADNYIRKPFLPQELEAILDALLRRGEDQIQIADNERKEYKLGQYIFCTEYHCLKYGGENIKLTSREAAILWLLYQNRGEVVKREEILNRFWGSDDFYPSRSLDVFVTKLRKYLKKDPSIEIQTIKGVGLKLVFPL